jgi:hypothetical protein
MAFCEGESTKRINASLFLSDRVPSDPYKRYADLPEFTKLGIVSRIGVISGLVFSRATDDVVSALP